MLDCQPADMLAESSFVRVECTLDRRCSQVEFVGRRQASAGLVGMHWDRIDVKSRKPYQVVNLRNAAGRDVW
jgi:hypothetical protein